MQGLELSRRYFEEVGLPMLKREFESYVERIAAGFVGPGSESWGYDDEISRDHDWGPSFCLWLDQADYHETGAELQKAYAQLPPDYLGYSQRQPLPGEESRVGVMSIQGFYGLYTGLDHPPQDLKEWAEIPVPNLALVTNGQVFQDPMGKFSAWRKVLASQFPQDLWLRQVAAKCMLAGQSGQYNLPRSVRRGDQFACHYALGQFSKEVLELVFWLNRRYPPYYKWLLKGVAELPILGGDFQWGVSRLLMTADFNEQVELVESLAQKAIDQVKALGLSGSTSDFLMDHGPEVQSRIKDPQIRSRFAIIA